MSSYYLNLGNEGFQSALKNNIYVDKTGLIGYTNGIISSYDRYTCVIRPRRFGKSMAAEMLEAYYCRTCDSHSQFDGLEISKSESYEAHINRYDVIKVDMSDVVNEDIDADRGIETFTKNLVYDLKKLYPDVDYRDETDLAAMLGDIYGDTKSGFVFIIDEWDCPFRERKDDEYGQRKYVKFLKHLLKGKAYVALAYMTGILPIKKLCTNSSLNMFREYSMDIPGPVKQYFGFTDDEVKALCDERGFSYHGVKDWYDGYVFEDGIDKKLHMYNANSVVSAITNNQFASYWPRTESLKDLRQYIKLNKDGLHDVLTELLAGNTYIIDGELFSEEDEDRKYLKEVLAQLVNLGYLAYDRSTHSVCIPNLEVRREFFEVVSGMGDDPLCRLVNMSADIVKATTTKDGERLEELIAKFHKDHAATRKFNDEDTLADVVRFAYIAALSDYWIESEAQTGKGYADLAFKPYDVGFNIPMVIELKYNKKAETAIEQIEDRHYVKYFDKFQLKGEILFVGINYDSGKEENGFDGTYTVKFETIKI